MKKLSLLLLLVVMLAPVGPAAAEIEFPLPWQTPAGWTACTYPLPPDFAQDMPFHGVEAVRFTPGFGDPKSHEFFTYAFAWLIDDKPPVVDWRMPQYLRRYYTGLMEQESRKSKLPIGGTRAAFSTEPSPVPVVVVDTYDGIFTGKPIRLFVRVQMLDTHAAGKRLLYFEVSPRPGDAGVQRDFATIRAQLQP